MGIVCLAITKHAAATATEIPRRNSRVCGHLPHYDDGCGDVPSRSIACIGFVVSCIHPSELLDLAEVVFDEVSPFVGCGIVGDVQDAVAFCWNDGIGPSAKQLGAQVVCIKGLVGHQGVEGQPFDQGRHPDNFTALTRQKHEAHQVAERVCQRQNLRRQPAFRAPDRLISSPPFAPLAFW